MFLQFFFSFLLRSPHPAFKLCLVDFLLRLTQSFQKWLEVPPGNGSLVTGPTHTLKMMHIKRLKTFVFT